ncbi:hypothetical protein EMIT0196MI5_170041 [Pseudomonas sp. IT-196MI5]
MADPAQHRGQRAPARPVLAATEPQPQRNALGNPAQGDPAQSRAQGRWFLGVATSQGPDALLARASSLADQVQVPGYLAPA